MPLTKAILVAKDSSAKNIEFMFNPQEIAFEESVATAESQGARGEKKGNPIVSFSYINATKITINNIVFDTFETGDNVFKTHIASFKKAVEFLGGEEKRPPIYSFAWGDTYLEYCFIDTLGYKLTKFLNDGTPVRAVIDSLVLKEIDPPQKDQSNPPKSKADPSTDNISNRKK